jgi:sugar/nucleoside kinase (ribokinase family)
MSRKVCIIGNLNADLVLYPVTDFPTWGTEVLVSSMDWRAGGVGNALLCLARLGVEVSAVANVGQDGIGQNLLSTLEQAGVDISHVERSPNVRTAVSVGIGREDGERAFVTHLGHLELLDIDLVLRHREAWKEAQWVLISGYFLMPGLGFKGTGKLIDEIHAEGKEVLLDTGWDVSGWAERTVEEVMQLLEKVDIFLPSFNEAQALTGENSPEGCLESLFARCASCVIIKMGEAGSIARTREGVFRHWAFPVLPLDTTGAGDSFNAGVMFGLLRDWDIRQTQRLANAVAAMVISRPREGGYPVLSEVEEYLSTNLVTREVEQ